MKILRVPQLRSLKDVPLDGVDMFMLSLAEDEIDLSELTEIAPRNALECLRRVLRLAELGLLQLRFDNRDQRLLAPGCDEKAAQEMLDNARTLRPPPAHSEEGRTLRPAPMAGSAARAEPTTGIRRRPTPAAHTPVAQGRLAR